MGGWRLGGQKRTSPLPPDALTPDALAKRHLECALFSNFSRSIMLCHSLHSLWRDTGLT